MLPPPDGSRACQRSRVLIIDYNTFYYTSFDVFRTVLCEPYFFMALKPEYRSFVKMNTDDQIRFFYRNQSHSDLYQLFDIEPTEEWPMDMYKLIEAHYEYPRARYTPTDLNRLLSAALGNKAIEKLYVLRHTLDESTELSIPPRTSILRTKGLFNVDAIVKLINKYAIDTVILDSVDMALGIAQQTSHMTIIFGSYSYNYEVDNVHHIKYPKHTEEFHTLETEKQHEFGKFSPFSNAMLYRKDEENA